MYHGAPEGLIEGLVCNYLETGKNLGAKEGLGRGTGIGIGIGLGIGIGKGLGIGKEELVISDNTQNLKNDFFKGLEDLK